MALVTGSAYGTILQQDDLYLDTAPTVYFQERVSGDGGYAFNPDADGFYWNLTGTSTNKVLEIGCYDTFQFVGNITMNTIRCDTVGDKGSIQKLNFVDITFNLKSFFPLETLRHIIRGGSVTTASGVEKMGIGQPNNNRFYRAYFPSVYDEQSGDYLAVTVHKAQFVDSWTMAINYGAQPTLGVILRGFADPNLPSDQLFATVIRSDASAIS